MSLLLHLMCVQWLTFLHAKICRIHIISCLVKFQRLTENVRFKNMHVMRCILNETCAVTDVGKLLTNRTWTSNLVVKKAEPTYTTNPSTYTLRAKTARSPYNNKSKSVYVPFSRTEWRTNRTQGSWNKQLTIPKPHLISYMTSKGQFRESLIKNM